MVKVTVKRQDLVKRLEATKVGLSDTEVLEQSNCYIFKNGKVWSFNDDVVSVAKLPPGMEEMECIVPAKELFELLMMLDEETVTISFVLDETQNTSELIIHAGRKEAGIRVQKEVLLPINEIAFPSSWNKVPEGFYEAVKMVQGCASKKEVAFVLSCLHLTSNAIEATDGYHAMRFRLATGIKGSVLVKKKVFLKISEMEMPEFAINESWLFFRDSFELVVGCRIWKDEFPDLSPFFDVTDAKEIVFPDDLASAIEKIGIFLDFGSNVMGVSVSISPSHLLLKGEGPEGWYKEIFETSYKGEPIKFKIAPRLLYEACSRSKHCFVDNGKLKIKTDQFDYVTCLSYEKD